MTDDLERRLVALGGGLDVPKPPPDVPARLPERRRRLLRPARRTVALGVAGALALGGTAMAVPPSRHEILRALLVGRALITEFRGASIPWVRKTIGPRTRVDELRIAGGYIHGAPHRVLFQAREGAVRLDRVRIAGNVLVWQRGPLTIRIEGTRTRAQALALARSLR